MEELELKELGIHRPLHAVSSFAAPNESYHSFWRSVSEVLGTKREQFPLSLFHASLDISGEDPVKEGEEKGILPAQHLSKIKRVNRRTLSVVLLTYIVSSILLLSGIGILISSTVLAPHHRSYGSDMPGLNYSDISLAKIDTLTPAATVT